MLKADLHIHTNQDKTDHIKYSGKEFLDLAAKLKFNIISFTHHREVIFEKRLEDYAKKKGILLIPGCEMEIERAHVLIYDSNPELLKKKVMKITSFEDLKKYKGNSLVIAPHPYYLNPIEFWKGCLHKKLEENIEMFDAIEYSHFYYKIYNPNNKAVAVAKKYGKPLIGTSDLHRLYNFNFTYSLIDSQKNIKSIFEAIRKNKVQFVTKQLPLRLFLKSAFLNATKLS